MLPRDLKVFKTYIKKYTYGNINYAMGPTTLGFQHTQKEKSPKKQSVVYDHLNKVCITYKVDRKKPWSEFVHSSPLFLVIIFQE